MELSLTTQEQELLLEVLRESMRELSREIVRTDCHAFKSMLRRREQLLEQLACKVAMPIAA